MTSWKWRLPKAKKQEIKTRMKNQMFQFWILKNNQGECHHTHTGLISAWVVKSSHWIFYQWWQQKDRAPWPSTLMKFPSAGPIMGVRDWYKGRVGASLTRSLLSASSLQFGVKDTLKGCRRALIRPLWPQNAIRGRPCLRGWSSPGLLHSHMSLIWAGRQA